MINAQLIELLSPPPGEGEGKKSQGNRRRLSLYHVLSPQMKAPT